MPVVGKARDGDSQVLKIKGRRGAMLIIPLALFLIATQSVGHYAWPKEISSIDDEIYAHQVAFAELPPHACERELDYPNTGTTGALYIDLNGDGVKELIVDDGQGGSGGPGYRIYQKSDGVWKVIADFQGGVTLCQKANRYYQLEVISRGGAGATNKSLYRYIGGRYRAVRSEDYKDGVFVRALDENELKNLDN
jgi:hypothetical protein